MHAFTFARASDNAGAITLAAATHGAKYLGGGTNLVDLMRENLERPDALVDVTHLSHTIEARDDGGILIGAAATNTEIAAHQAIRSRFPALSRAILSGASGQIRNMATAAGNILQRTRCTYFYDTAAKCNKRAPGSGCDALQGFNRIHAVLGASDACVATHPSDMCVALAAFDAIVHLNGPDGARRMDLTALHRLPGDTPQHETNLRPNELITTIELPPLGFAKNSTYRKVRDRASYAFALLSVAASIELERGAVKDIRVAFGGVAAKPWRAEKLERALRGQKASMDNFRAAAAAEFADAKPLAHNAFKIDLGKRVIPAVLAELSAGAVS